MGTGDAVISGNARGPIKSRGVPAARSARNGGRQRQFGFVEDEVVDVVECFRVRGG